MRFQIMSHALGHETLDFDRADPAQLKAAQEKFDELVRERKMIAAQKGENGDLMVSRTFNPDAEQTVFVAQMKGG